MSGTGFRSISAAAALFTLAATAAAQPPAIAAKTVNLRAGPARDYPLVARVGAGAPLAIQGCIPDYSWCDVVVPGNIRGWVYAGNISYPYQESRVPLIQYGAVIGLPIVGFALGSYWGDYYRNRPFYRDRGRWEHRPMPRGPVYGRPPPGFTGPGPGSRPPPRGFEGGGRTFDHGRPPMDRRPGGQDLRPGGGRPDGAGRPGGPGPRAEPGGGGDRRGDRGGDRGPGGGRGGDPGGERGGGPGGDHGGGRPGR